MGVYIYVVTLLPSNGGWAYISNSVRERERGRGGEGVGTEIERDIGR